MVISVFQLVFQLGCTCVSDVKNRVESRVTGFEIPLQTKENQFVVPGKGMECKSRPEVIEIFTRIKI